MTVGEWVRARSPTPPPALTSGVIAALGSRADAAVDGASELCLDAAIAVLEQLLASDALQRSAAMELLAADALVTYAFEAAAANPERLENRAAGAMVRLAALASDDRRAARDR
jgi:hypothetical protein